MAYRRRRTSTRGRRSYSRPSRTYSRRRTTRRTTSRRASGGTIRLVIEQAAPSGVARPSIHQKPAPAGKKARF